VQPQPRQLDRVFRPRASRDRSKKYRRKQSEAVDHEHTGGSAGSNRWRRGSNPNLHEASGRTLRVNDIEMFVEVRGTGEPLVLVHGFFTCGSTWGPVADLLATQYQVIIPDLRGHGRSTNSAGTFTHRQSAIDVYAARSTRGEALQGDGDQHRRNDPSSHGHPAAGPDRCDGTDWCHLVFSRADAHRARRSRRFFPVNIPVEMYRAIPEAALWIVPNGGHIPFFAGIWPPWRQLREFQDVTLAFLRNPQDRR